MINQNARNYLTEAQTQILISYVKSRADLARKRGALRAVIDEIIVLMLLKAGLRANELCELKIKDLSKIHNEKFIRIYNANRDIVRNVEISADLAELLTRFVKLYRKKANRKDTLLESERGNPISYLSLYNKVRKIGEKAGIGKLSPSILRHTYVVQLYNVEQDLRYVKEQAGYTSRRELAKYLKIISDQKKNAKSNRSKLKKHVQINQNARDSKSIQKCEACGAKITTGSGKRIDSGQLLCQDCQKYFRST